MHDGSETSKPGPTAHKLPCESRLLTLILHHILGTVLFGMVVCSTTLSDQPHNPTPHLKAEEAVAGTVGRVQDLSFRLRV